MVTTENICFIQTLINTKSVVLVQKCTLSLIKCLCTPNVMIRMQDNIVNELRIDLTDGLCKPLIKYREINDVA